MTNKNPELTDFFLSLEQESLLVTLPENSIAYYASGRFQEAFKEKRYVSPTGMNSFLKKWAKKASLHLESEIERVSFSDNKWVLYGKQGKIFDDFDACVFSLPPKQLEPFYDLSSKLKEKLPELLPCLALMLVTDKVCVTYPSAFLKSERLCWYSSSNCKNYLQKWLVHASPSWSLKYFNEDPKEIQKKMIEELEKIVGIHLSLKFKTFHRWRYAFNTGSLSVSSFWDSKNSLGFMGDWFVGGRVEGAMTSAYSLYKSLSPSLHKK